MQTQSCSMYACTRHLPCLQLSAGQRPQLLLQYHHVAAARTRLLTFFQLELDLFDLLRSVFLYSITLSLMLNGVVPPEEEYDRHYSLDRSAHSTLTYTEAHVDEA